MTQGLLLRFQFEERQKRINSSLLKQKVSYTNQDCNSKISQTFSIFCTSFKSIYQREEVRERCMKISKRSSSKQRILKYSKEPAHYSSFVCLRNIKPIRLFPLIPSCKNLNTLRKIIHSKSYSKYKGFPPIYALPFVSHFFNHFFHDIPPLYSRNSRRYSRKFCLGSASEDS